MLALRAILALLLVFISAANAVPSEKQSVLAFTFTHADPEKAKVEPFPFFRVFPGGKDKAGVDATSSLSWRRLSRGIRRRVQRGSDYREGSHNGKAASWRLH